MRKKINSKIAITAINKAFKEYRLMLECEVPANKIRNKVNKILVDDSHLLSVFKEIISVNFDFSDDKAIIKNADTSFLLWQIVVSFSIVYGVYYPLHDSATADDITEAFNAIEFDYDVAGFKLKNLKNAYIKERCKNFDDPKGFLSQFKIK
jgi:hypothetical protein